MTKAKHYLASVLAGLVGLAATAAASAETLRLLTWGNYAPPELVKKFKQETGIDVQITLSNNEDIISRLRATGGAGFDLAQPSHDRIVGPQADFRIYKPLDLSKVKLQQFTPSLLEAAKASSTIAGKVYALPFTWGTLGVLTNNAKAPNVSSIADLCADAHKGKVTMRIRRPALILMAFANGDDPFAAYGEPDKYQGIIDRAGQKLAACKANVKAYWNNSDDLLNMMRSGEVVAAEGWDLHAIKLQEEGMDTGYDKNPLGWIDTFVLPAKGRADEAAYKWVDFVMRPENAALIMQSSGNMTASVGAQDFASEKLRKSLERIYSPQAIAHVRWFPPIPAGLEQREGKILDRIAAQ
ncbi:extracellular solute-binding protein [Verminephrobacter eiseniae]|uniref:extracellular solute-binding protein n=1 Tax=Verminephrobacter eiseniae TaxID=364317 RepID=UPI0022391083|nr:extracellular solute-binding protein [Verminephrobacter eiseniae]MCW5230367.1 extracellular solute-binding protein [Verminephrobacter eiseniae]MCW5292101.1 extracellular solute-binding protein [Verminephrobacter eiseniae]MCW8184825.1 extracellular solute-binding protein [Verminephrobacter eiseniae]MCW8222563.1 extracellular solute-binding protein [Verminephrobacter eiseniae]MCW8233546.1 extracellular solute-binding protein [Verminephrobacter eiseniae]